MASKSPDLHINTLLFSAVACEYHIVLCWKPLPQASHVKGSLAKCPIPDGLSSFGLLAERYPAAI